MPGPHHCHHMSCVKRGPLSLSLTKTGQKQHWRCIAGNRSALYTKAQGKGNIVSEYGATATQSARRKSQYLKVIVRVSTSKKNSKEPALRPERVIGQLMRKNKTDFSLFPISEQWIIQEPAVPRHFTSHAQVQPSSALFLKKFVFIILGKVHCSLQSSQYSPNYIPYIFLLKPVFCDFITP